MALEFPTIYLLSAHLSADELHELEEQIPSLTYNINEASIVLGKISKKQRALLELRQLKVVTEEIPSAGLPPSHRAKRRRTSGPEEKAHDGDTSATYTSEEETSQGTSQSSSEVIKVVKLAWFTDSLKAGTVLPLADYLIYEGRKIPQATPKGTSVSNPPVTSSPRAKDGRKRPELHKETTSEHDTDAQLPPIPDYLHTTYSCQRPTPVNPPNEEFIEELMKIRTTRTLLGDNVGVRAYSSAIATLAAYPYTLTSPKEIARLPGCGAKIAAVYKEFRETGSIKEAEEVETDPKLSVLKLFHSIWGVGDTTAREFYNKGWRDLDDIVEFGWDGLSRVQQIGVKYFDEFREQIPRSEVEDIANTVLRHANELRPGFQMVIAGGYRRGKEKSGDVDVILSNPDKNATHGFVEKLVDSLEDAGLITHTLILSTTNSERGQTPVAWKGNMKKAGTGFDTLDKALVVWQEPQQHASESDKGAKNTNPHRRVDIIISPWKTAGCAVLGWTSGTTFQRDLRRYCKRERGLKFDSSGVRSRVDGSFVDLESGPEGPAPDMLTAERRVFAGLGLEWRPPEERCTG